jgi:hypothetical protein
MVSHIYVCGADYEAETFAIRPHAAALPMASRRRAARPYFGTEVSVLHRETNETLIIFLIFAEGH